MPGSAHFILGGLHACSFALCPHVGGYHFFLTDNPYGWWPSNQNKEEMGTKHSTTASFSSHCPLRTERNSAGGQL